MSKPTPSQEELIKAFELIASAKYQDLATAFQAQMGLEDKDAKATNAATAKSLKAADMARNIRPAAEKEARAPDGFQESCAFMSAMIKDNDYPALCGHMAKQIYRAANYYEIPQKVAAVVYAACYVLKTAATTSLDFLADPKGTTIKGFENLANALGSSNPLCKAMSTMCRSMSEALKHPEKSMDRVKETMRSSCEQITAIAHGMGQQAAVAR